jgi:hypothetical protein
MEPPLRRMERTGFEPVTPWLQIGWRRRELRHHVALTRGSGHRCRDIRADDQPRSVRNPQRNSHLERLRKCRHRCANFSGDQPSTFVRLVSGPTSVAGVISRPYVQRTGCGTFHLRLRSSAHGAYAFEVRWQLPARPSPPSCIPPRIAAGIESHAQRPTAHDRASSRFGRVRVLGRQR